MAKAKLNKLFTASFISNYTFPLLCVATIFAQKKTKRHMHALSLATALFYRSFVILFLQKATNFDSASYLSSSILSTAINAS